MTNTSRFIRSCVGLAVAVGLVVPSASWAQAAKGKKVAVTGGVEIEEITVTAQKREESIQETPISMTALTSEALVQHGVTDVVDIGQSVPNMRIVSNPGSPASTTITIRGLTQGNPEAAFQPKVGMYVDGVYLAKIVGNNLDLEDIERVEVLRGPQGTLYGRNTIGGAVNFITKKPDENRSVSLKTDIGNYEAFNGRLTFNVPLVGPNGYIHSDALGTISLRETVGYKTHAGYYRNALFPSKLPRFDVPGLGGPSSIGGTSNYVDLNRVFNFTALRWQPIKEFTVDYAWEYHRYRDHPTASQVTYVYPRVIGPGGFPIAGFTDGLLNSYIQTNRGDSTPNNALRMSDLATLHQHRDDGNHRLHMLTGTWEIGDLGWLGNVTLKSISSYRSFTYQSEQDLDGSPFHIAEFSQMNDIQHWSEELQWTGNGPRFHYVLGAYYYGEYAMQRESQVFFGGQNNLPYRNFNKVKSYAPYGQVTLTPPILNDKLSVTLGLRYTQEQVHMDHVIGKLLSPAASVPGYRISGGKAFGGTEALSPLAKIAYQLTDDVMLYASGSRGFTGGGFNPTGIDANETIFKSLFTSFKPETLWAIEAGFKSQWLDNRLRLNADGFLSLYSDLQQSVFRSSPELGAFSVPSNVDSAEIWGMEFEGTAIPVRGLEATVNYSFLAPKFTKWLDQKFNADGTPAFDPITHQAVLESVADKRSFNFSPKHQATVGLTYTAPPTTTGTFSAHVEAYYQDKVTFITNNQTAGAQADEGWAYYLLSGRIAYTGIPLQKGTLDLAVFARNLLDKKYRTYGIDFGPQFGYAINVYGDPRTFGVQLAYNFDAGPVASEAPPPAPMVQAAPPPPPPPAKKKIVLRSVHFDFDKATLRADATPILDEAIQVLKEEGSIDIVVEGHTDSVGTDQYNLGLSHRRADTVRRYLVEHGVKPSRITSEGFGESKPVASNDTADGRAQNRRVELHVR